MGSPPPDGTNDSCGRPESATMICSLLRSRTVRFARARQRHPERFSVESVACNSHVIITGAAVEGFNPFYTPPRLL